MDAMNAFARMPDSPETIIAQVRRDLQAPVSGSPGLPDIDLDRLAETVVRELWQSKVKTFVPVLALRQAREMLRERDPVIAPPIPVMVAGDRNSSRGRRDLLLITGDVLRIDDDVIVLND